MRAIASLGRKLAGGRFEVVGFFRNCAKKTLMPIKAPASWFVSANGRQRRTVQLNLASESKIIPLQISHACLQRSAVGGTSAMDTGSVFRFVPVSVHMGMQKMVGHERSVADSGVTDVSWHGNGANRAERGVLRAVSPKRAFGARFWSLARALVTAFSTFLAVLALPRLALCAVRC